MHRAWRRLCLIGAGIVWMTAAGCQEGNQEEPLLEEVEEIREEIDGIMSSVQTLKELKILQMYYNGQVEFFSEEEKEDFLCVTGEYGRSAEAGLGMKEGCTVRQLARRAREKVDFWHERASGFMLPGAYVEAAATLARSYEQMYLHLSALSEE